MEPQLDPSVVALTKAIGHQESGGNYSKIGDNGHSKGAYQWNNSTPLQKDQIPKNFGSYASDVGADPNDFSPANQDRVAYKTVEKWGKEGLTPAQVASKWNSGNPDAYKNAKPGYNAQEGVNYDVKSYVDNVAKYYDVYRNANSGDSSNGYVTSANLPQSQDTPQENKPTLVGSILRDIVKTPAKVATSLVQAGEVATGNKLTEPFTGGYLGRVEPLGGGIEGDTGRMVKEGVLGGVEVGGLLAGANAGKIVKGIGGLIKGSSALENPEVVSILKNSIGKGETIADLSREDAINALGNQLKEMSVKESGGKTEQAILKALKQLNPTIKEKQSLLKKLAKGGYNTAKNYLLVKALGDTVGGFIHKITS